MRPPRLKLRTLIVLVALATLAAGGVEYRRRAARYRALAMREAAAAKRWDTIAADIRKNITAWPQGQQTRRARLYKDLEDAKRRGDDRRFRGLALRLYDAETEERRMNPVQRFRDAETGAAFQADRHARRRAAYLRCARYPWLSPPADEPEQK